MRIVREVHEIYTYGELDEDAKDKAVGCLYDVNVDYEWWDFTYEDAKEVGLKITGFDTGRGACCEGALMVSAQHTIDRILEDHGTGCETFQTATEYNGKVEKEDEDGYVEEMEEASEFLKAILEDYRIILQKEYEYLTSREAIKETIEASGYEFAKDGTFPAY